ncbi:hypothetical protein [Hoeflea ulvae]|uniref:N-acetyltransferase domain-containing protein n=1 Tax=Hoeflea ulvae TaxID=2983764 RepID=A0ABT3YIY5_9HYPH|nr:hypothetical protein [Hoeflea ulvae]MCY0095700.1 hypothetical protein [Hoeflea ulvae]
MTVDPRALSAAGNNADLYAAMFASHGLASKRLPHVFVGIDRPPPYYSNLTVLAPGHGDEIAAELRVLGKKFAGALGVKDSFCELDPAPLGFEILFGASWIWRAAGVPASLDGWERIADQAGLELWEETWKNTGSPTRQRMFRPSLLERPDIAFLGRREGGEIVSGCIANLSGDCVGISNVFSKTPPDGLFVQAAAAVASLAPHLPITGYESGEDLQQARRAGFETVGDLRILVSRAARM